LEYALNKDNKLINADEASYGIYYCPECKKPCELRHPFEKKKSFFHFRIDPNCSLCYKYLNGFNNFKNNEICNNAGDMLIKNITK
jgi:hypothetical protein